MAVPDRLSQTRADHPLVASPPRARWLAWAGQPAGQSWLALLFFALTSSLMLYPMFPDFFTRLVATGDAYEYVWKMWWFKHSLLETGQSPWVVPDIYYPHGYLLAYGETAAASTLFSLPLTWLLGEIATYNLLILASTILSGFGMFLLAREVSGNFGAGLFAGIVFAFAPLRRLQFLHLNTVVTQWFPLFFYCLERFARTRKPVYGLLAGLFFALNALSSWYYAVAGTLFLMIWSLVRFRPLGDYLRQRQTWLAAGLFGAVALVLIVPFAVPYLAILGSSDFSAPMENSNYYSASLTDYLLPSPFQFWWGDWVNRNLLVQQPDPGEFILGWSYMAWLFVFYSFRRADRARLRPWLVVMILALVLSFGLTLHLVGRQVVIPAPQAVVDGFNETLNDISLNYSRNREPFTIGRPDGLVVPLPALLLRWFAPVFGQTRTWTRFGFVVLVAIAVIAALGAAAWHRRDLAWYSPNQRRAAWLLVLGLALFELWWLPSPMATPVLERPVDRWLRQQPGRDALIQYPLNSSFSSEQLIYSRAHGKPMVQAYGTFFGFMLGRRHPELMVFPEPDSLQQLSEWGVRYVLLETRGPGTEDAPELLQQIAGIPCLRPLTVQDSVYVFELVDCP